MNKINKNKQQNEASLLLLSSSSAPSDSAFSPSPQRSFVTNNAPTSALVDSECQVSFPMLFENSTDFAFPLARDAINQKLADAEFLLREAQTVIAEQGKKKQQQEQYQQNESSSSILQHQNNDAAAEKWKSLFEEERKSIDALRKTYTDNEFHLRAQHAAEIQKLEQRFRDDLDARSAQFERQNFAANRQILFQKEENSRSRILVDESEAKETVIVAEYCAIHLGDAKAQLAIATRDAETFLQERNEFELQAKELREIKDKIEKELIENTRAMMGLQAGGAATNESFSAKSPSKSKFGFF